MTTAGFGTRGRDRLLQHVHVAAVVFANHVGDVAQRQAKAQVGLVRAVPPHGLGKGQTGEGRGDVKTQDVFPQRGHQAFHHGLYVLFDNEAHLEIDLGKLGLPVLAQILIAEAADDLEVTIEPRHHEKLLEELRRLSQGIEGSRASGARARGSYGRRPACT